jgi:hypothetical protein
MSILDETQFLERFQFFNGQRLFASDLQGADDFNREMRWLHNKSLHQPGIGSGFAVYGKKGDREVVIAAGYAVDSLGREIVLTNTMTLQVPPVASDDSGEPVFYDLAVSYPDDSALEETETREGICLARGVVRRREVPVLCWLRLDSERQPIDERLKKDVRAGMRLILCRIEVLNCQLNKDISIAERRNARPPRLPNIVCGEETPTQWTMFNIGVEAPPATAGFGGAFIAGFGLRAKVDTSTAAFQVTPSYTARIKGPRIKTLVVDESNFQMIVDGVIAIPAETSNAKEFTVDVLLLVQPMTQSFLLSSMRSGGIPDDEQGPFLDLFDDWHVVWMGVES